MTGRVESGLDAYRAGKASFIVGLPPSRVLALSAAETLAILRDRLGRRLDLALEAASVEPSALPPGVASELCGPVADEPDGSWLKRANVVGINVRTVGDVWGVVAYVMTLPAIQNAIHLLPLLEPGVVGSLYGPVSWEVDPAIRSATIAQLQPGLDTAERQLRAVVHVLHALGRAVGMDVIPHTDRFSEIVLAQPDHFEWLERDGKRIVRHGPELAAAVEGCIVDWLRDQRPAVIDREAPRTPEALFRGLAEGDRLEVLFGPREDPAGRRARRIALIRALHGKGYETVPATMAPPYRGVEVDERADARIVDELGLIWRDYRMTSPEPMSRVFGPLARYALYEPLAGTDPWALDFDRHREAVWRYVCEHYADLRDRFGFDFMRGDMAHVQMRREGVPDRIEPHYDILGAVRRYIREERGVRSFGFLAETFLAPPGTMAYGDEMDHLEAAGADTTLGDLQSIAVGEPAFIQRLGRYRDLLATRACAPSFTVMTADKDDPRFDGLYSAGNEVRLFLALLLPDMPSYMGLGFETRDVHLAPAPNEHYTKLYVFQRTTGRGATRGPYVWGRNEELFAALTRIRLFADGLREELGAMRTVWLRPPDATGADGTLAWLLDGEAGRYLCLANLDTARATGRFGVPTAAVQAPPPAWEQVFSTHDPAPRTTSMLLANGPQWVVPSLGPGEGRVYRPAGVAQLRGRGRTTPVTRGRARARSRAPTPSRPDPR